MFDLKLQGQSVSKRLGLSSVDFNDDDVIHIYPEESDSLMRNGNIIEYAHYYSIDIQRTSSR